ncbi:MAG: hypothetical protein WA971_13265 [Microbacterium sp.]
MTTLTTTPASVAASRPARLPLWRRILFRVGLVLTAFMGLMNTLNGGSALLGMQDARGAVVIAWLLFGIGLPTLLLVGTAWIPRQWALCTVIVLRFLEAGTMWIPMGPGDWYQAPENRPFYLGLVAASLVVCALMSLGLQRRRRP